MRKFFFRISIILILNMTPLKIVYSDVFIVAIVNQEIITNIDVDFEKKYLVSLNPNLKKLDQSRITEYAKDSLINEKIKKIEIEKKYEIVTNEILLSKVIADIYSSIGISSLAEFESYLLLNDIDIQRVKEKISIEIAWNDLIVKLFNNEIEIDRNLLNKKIENFDKRIIDNLLLSEIIFTVKNKNDLNLKYNEIKESINEIGFEETARIYSLSDSKKSGGNLGWIYKNQLSKEIRDEVNKLSVGNYTKPIVTGGGFLILKLNDLKTESIEVNKDVQLNKMIKFERERQFTRFSTLYYKRIYNDAEIDEK